MEKPTVYFTDFRCPVGTSRLDKLKKLCIAAGIKDIRTKAIRSNNPCNVVRATINGLSQLRSAEEVAAVRGKTVKEIVG